MATRARANLDDPKLRSRLDPSGLRERLRQMPGHCELAWRQAGACPLPSAWPRCDKVVIGGMGGSAIAGELAADLASLQGTVPVLVVRDQRLPFRVDEHTLFIACSYSGETQETLALFRQAARANARIMAICSGGRLAEWAEAGGFPLLNVGVSVEPRSAVVYNLMLLLGVLRRLGLVTVADEEAEAAVQWLLTRVSQLGEDAPTRDNRAKQLAMELRDKLILVYGGGLYAGVSRRWKSQLNENAKAWAFSETIPELLHNTVEAFGALQAFAGRVTALLLEPNTAESLSGRPYSALSEMLRRNNIPHHVLREDSGPPLAELLGMVLLGDYVSYYLALLQGMDPSPTPGIAMAKQLLAAPPESQQQ